MMIAFLIPDWYWIFFICWLVFTGLIIFLLPELIAYFSKPKEGEAYRDDTFSGFIWRWQGTSSARKRTVFFILLGLQVLIFWLIFHFLFGVV